MAERNPIERLNDVLEGRSSDAQAAGREFRELVVLARRLRGMPREDFRVSLRNQLEEEAMASTTTAALPLREGFHSVTPYLVVQGAAQFIEFAKQVFGAEEKGRFKTPDGSRIMHAELKIGDSMIELGDANEQFPPRPAAIHLYVPDADSVYQRALAAGAASLHPVEEMPYGERSASVQDPFGNQWYIATYHGPSHIREGCRTVNTSLLPVGAEKLIEFLKLAFDGELLGMHHDETSGAIRHATIRLGDTVVEVGEAHGPYGPLPTGLHYYVTDVDAVYERALKAGATSIRPPADQPYGERGAAVMDPTGNSWFLATPLPARG